MLHKDSEQRILEIKDISQIFAEKQFPQTSKEILNYITILEGDKIPSDFLAQLDHLLITFSVEFRDMLPVGKENREKYFEEIKGLIIQAMGRLGTDFGPAYMTILPIAVNLKQGRNNLTQISDEITKNPAMSPRCKFYLYSLMYVTLVEGVFDEVTRILHFLKTVTKTASLKIDELNALDVWDIYNLSNPKPVFLNDWKRKKAIRNSIGHSSYTFDEKANTIHFVNIHKGIETFNETIPFGVFAELALEMESCVEAYSMITIILRLLDLVRSPNAYIT